MAELLKTGTLGTSADGVLFTLNGTDGFGVGSGGKVLGDADATGVNYSIWEDGSVVICNESGATRTVDVKVETEAGAIARLGPKALKLQVNFAARLTSKGVEVWNTYGELQMGYSTQNAS